MQVERFGYLKEKVETAKKEYNDAITALEQAKAVVSDKLETLLACREILEDELESDGLI